MRMDRVTGAILLCKRSTVACTCTGLRTICRVHGSEVLGAPFSLTYRALQPRVAAAEQIINFKESEKSHHIKTSKHILHPGEVIPLPQTLGYWTGLGMGAKEKQASALDALPEMAGLDACES